MFNKDWIFWLAISIFILGVILSGITQNEVWLFILAGSYLLRPTLASLNISRSHVDERQMSIQYRSGNIAFAVMIISCIVFAIFQNVNGDQSWEFFSAVVIIGLAAKALSNVFLIGNYRESGTKIIISVGLLIALFSSLGHGFSMTSLMESLPGWGIAGIGLLSKKFPRTIGGIVLGITVILLIIILSKGLIIGQIITAVLVSVPLATAGVSLIAGDRVGEEVESD